MGNSRQTYFAYKNFALAAQAFSWLYAHEVCLVGERMYQPYEWDSHASAFCFTIDVDAESPQLWRSRLAGVKGLNQLEQRRYGLRQGLWHLLERLAAREVPATCFVPLYEAASRPWLLEALTSRGHEIGLHGHMHETVTDISTARFLEIMEETLEAVTRLTGTRPVGFRSPAWEMTPDALGVLRNLGMLYDSSLSGYDHPYEWDGPAEGLVELPIQWPLDDAVFFRFVGGGGDHWPPAATSELAVSWLEGCRAIHEQGGLCVTTMHPWLTGRACRVALAEAVLDHIVSTPGVWVATACQVAAWHVASNNRGRHVAEVAIPEFVA